MVNGERSLLVLAGAGSGKTSVLVARAGWLLARGEASPEQILLLAFGRKAAQEMDERLQARLHTDEITARTFHALALFIIQQGSKKVPVVSKLENDAAARHALFTQCWQAQCREKKAQAKGWRLWLQEELGWDVADESFWENEKIIKRMGSRLDRWVSLMRMHGGAQAEMIAAAPEDVRDLFAKRIKLMAPLLKAWKTALKKRGRWTSLGLSIRPLSFWKKANLSAHGNIFWLTSSRISPRSARRCWPHCGNRIRKPRCMPWEMIGKLSIASAVRSYH